MSKKWNGKRIAYIDVAKGIGIILVVCGHIIAEGNKPFKYSNIIHGYIYSFHMALFFIDLIDAKPFISPRKCL